MKKTNPFMQRYEELPLSLSLFPLSNTVFFPGGALPLNIFEPRYLNMIRDSMRSDQLIGMIQPSDDSSPAKLHRVGCAGRITRYIETADGRLEILLTGLCRFEIKEELKSIRGYRVAIPNWSNFESDFATQSPPDNEAIMLFKSALRTYFNDNTIEADWQVLEKLGIEDLINSLCSYLPLSSEDKQILIEAETAQSRLIAFTAILNGNARQTTIRH